MDNYILIDGGNLTFEERIKRFSHSNTFIEEKEWDNYVYSELEKEKIKYCSSSNIDEYEWDHINSKIIEDIRCEWKIIKNRGGYQYSKKYIENRDNCKIYNYNSINKYNELLDNKLIINYTHIKKVINKSVCVKIYHKNTNEKIIENMIIYNNINDKLIILYKCGIVYDLIEESIYIYISKNDKNYEFVVEYDVMENNYMIFNNIEINRDNNINIKITLLDDYRKEKKLDNYYVIYNKGTKDEKKININKNLTAPFIYNRKVYTITNKYLQEIIKEMYTSYVLVDNYSEINKNGNNRYTYNSTNYINNNSGLKLIVDYIHIKKFSHGDTKVLVTHKCSNNNIRENFTILRLSDKKILYDCNILYIKNSNIIKFYDTRQNRNYGYEKVMEYDISENNHFMYNNVFIYIKDNIYIKITIYDDLEQHNKMDNYFIFNSGEKIELSKYEKSLYIFNKIKTSEELKIINNKKTFSKNNICLQNFKEKDKELENKLTNILESTNNIEKIGNSMKKLNINDKELINVPECTEDIEKTDDNVNISDNPIDKLNINNKLKNDIINMNKIIYYFNNMEKEIKRLSTIFKKNSIRIINKNRYVLKAPLNLNILKYKYPINKNKFKLKPLLHNKYLVHL